MKYNQGIAGVWIVIIIAAVVALGGVGVYTTTAPEKDTEGEVTATTTPEESATTTPSETGGDSDDGQAQTPPPPTPVVPPPPPAAVTPPPPPPAPVACTADAMVCPDGSSVGRVPPTCEFAACPEVPEPVVEEPTVVQFSLLADDNGAVPDEFTVDKGDVVELTFEVSTQNVRFGGLLFQSEDKSIDSGDVSPGSSKTVMFIADEDQTIRAFWPSSKTMKPFLIQVIVNE